MKQPIPFGKYYLLERVNVGGMAEVFKAKATGVEGFERLVAVKRILPSIAEDEEFITMFVDEAKIAVQLTHANIGQIFDLGRVDGSYFIALEFVHGKDLRAIFNRSRQRGEILPIPLSCYAIMKLCEGLDYAHNKHDSAGQSLHLVHRDVSPQNILVSYEGEVKIIDFGIAKAAGKAGRTQAGILKGKFGYMSPEQVQGYEIDRRSDVFGVGICLYELLTGERLFIAESDFATLEKVRSVDIQPPSTYNQRIPEELEQIVLRALARDRDVRYQTALALHDDLQAFMHTSGNLFSRKDLSTYMRRVFGEEIEKESARDRQFEQLGHPKTPAAARHAESNGHDEEFQEDEEESVRDSLPPPSLGAGNGSLSAAGAIAQVALAADPLQLPEARKRTNTLLGVPRAAAPRIPTVPRPIPSPASIPPLTGVRPASTAQSSGALATQSSQQGMEWDDEELSTQIYDKPDQPSEDELDGMQVSVPQPRPAPNAIAAAIHAYRPELRTYPPVRPPSVPPPAPALPSARARLPTERIEWKKPAPKHRPMLAAVASVIAIVAAIVLGLLVFGQRDPGTVNLTTQPSRVAVSVDGHALGVSTSPFVIGELTPGRRHDIVVSSPGYRPWTHVVELNPGETLSLPDVMLARIETGFSLTTEPAGAMVYVDDQARPDATPTRVVDLAPGDHRVRVELAGWSSWESVLQANTGTVLPLPNVVLQPLARSDAEDSPPPTARGARAKPTGSAARGGKTSGKGNGDELASRGGVPNAPEPSASDDSADDSSDDEEDKPKPRPASKPPANDVLAEISKAAQQKTAAAEVKAAPEPKPEPAPAEQSEGERGKLKVNSRPWAQVFIDGKAYGPTPKMNITLPVGSHKVELVNDEFGVKRNVDVHITSGKTETVVVNLLE